MSRTMGLLFVRLCTLESVFEKPLYNQFYFFERTNELLFQVTRGLFFLLPSRLEEKFIQYKLTCNPYVSAVSS